MFIHLVHHYIPEKRVSNAYFNELNDLDENWIESRTGIKTRSRAGEDETTHTMGVKVAQATIEKLSFPKEEIDLIVGASYTPIDTIYTLGHAVQRELDLPEMPVVYVSAACSSLVNAVEIVEGYFAMGKAKKALVVASEHNTAYSKDTNKKSGMLWGDGACAFVLSKERISEHDFEVLEIKTAGAATIGFANESVNLEPGGKGLYMDNGRDVFIHACNYMGAATQQILENNGYGLENLDWLITHQANLRITKNVIATYNIPEEKTLSNLPYLGNTGCAGCGIVLSENTDKFKAGDILVVSVFGGGYSYGAMLIKK